MACSKCGKEVAPAERVAYGSFCEDCFVGVGSRVEHPRLPASDRRAVHAHAFYPFRSGQRRGRVKPSGQY